MLLRWFGDVLRPRYSFLSSSSSRSKGACECPRTAISVLDKARSSSRGPSLDSRVSSLASVEMRKGVGEGCRAGRGRVGDSREDGVRIVSPPGSLLSEVVMHANGHQPFLAVLSPARRSMEPVTCAHDAILGTRQGLHRRVR